jgi:hypothetical protein
LEVEQVAFMLVGEKNHRSVYLDSVKAFLNAPQHHGIVKPLVLAERVAEAVKAAYEQGMIDAKRAVNR